MLEFDGGDHRIHEEAELRLQHDGRFHRAVDGVPRAGSEGLGRGCRSRRLRKTTRHAVVI